MNAFEVKRRTQDFALRVMSLVEKLPKSKAADIIGKQLLRAGTSVGANYRSSCRARSKADFIAKMGIVEEETDETIYWIELLIKAGFIEKTEVAELLNEANQLLSITVASIKSARANR